MKLGNSGQECALQTAHIEKREEKLSQIRKFTLFSNTFMTVALDDIGACQYVLRVLTGNRKLQLKKVKTQYVFPQIDAHDAQLDVLAESMEGKIYALEIQRKDDGIDHPRRSRFYEAMIDSRFLEKGKEYSKLPDVTLLYICSGDFMKNKTSLWTVEKYQGRSGRTYEDGLCTQYVSAGIKDGTEVARLMEYFQTADPDDMSHGKLSERVHFLKCEKEGQKIMCEVTEQFWKWGFEEGERRGERRGEQRGERRGIRRGRSEGKAELKREIKNLIAQGKTPEEVIAIFMER